MPNNLHSNLHSAQLYENRYAKGYLENWPIEKILKITEVIHSLPLPNKGKVLDFGCGNGVLTEVLRQALPNWEIYGTDITETSIQNAKQRFPECTFFRSDAPNYSDEKFTFVFSHHVFEHVYDLQDAFDQMMGYLEEKSFMLHFLPCGNAGSYEHNICLLKKNGINPDVENRFFFEDSSHLRRLTTEQFKQLTDKYGFTLEKEYYSNQHYGAINHITNSDPGFVLMLTDSSSAIDKSAQLKLVKMRVVLFIITLIRLPARIVDIFLTKRKRSLKHYVLLLLAVPFYVFSIPTHLYLKKKAKEEWDAQKINRNGSEMVLFFKRDRQEA